jgi:hypothetical protein
MPETFKDLKGREWRPVVTVGTIEKARDFAGVNLADFSDLEKLGADPVALAKCLYVCCDPESHGVEPEDFAGELRADVIEEAAEALILAVVGFFPKARRTKLNALIAAGREAATKAEAEATALMSGTVFPEWLAMKSGEWRETLEEEMRADLARRAAPKP